MPGALIAHLSIGVRDLAAAQRFYDAALAPLGYRCLFPRADHAGYGAQAAYFWLNEVARPVPPDPASGLNICFDAPSRAAVDAFYTASLAAGATDNGKPGVRPQYRQPYYAAFVIDPDGYRIEAYCGKE